MRERELVEREAIQPSDWRRVSGVSLRGERRAFRVPVAKAEVIHDEGVVLRFELPAGAYASNVVAEVTKARKAAQRLDSDLRLSQIRTARVPRWRHDPAEPLGPGPMACQQRPGPCLGGCCSFGHARGRAPTCSTVARCRPQAVGAALRRPNTATCPAASWLL